ncbi:hypothetical protein KGQ20_04065 [Catenulispora sp. NF23]|uniref:Uncharacterized protein n=1 Tax=Catenulispora pinistramenti TaxID=2705254 RepID=A0ABS5KKB0_9ACTN|nr:hypothetical protein [Catenulispora pinistramenti]MBS2531939.1 hypothetical protein [Catenulispora pinistramenti]MBS2546206.1 hypothetical protein [Catenulispora pinistramenti]
MAQMADLRAARTAASDRLGGQLGRLRQEFATRQATEADVKLVADAHMALMDAAAALIASTGRKPCSHGVMGGPACPPCVWNEDTQTVAWARARRDVMKAGGFGPLGSPWDPALERTEGVSAVRPFMKDLGAR